MTVQGTWRRAKASPAKAAKAKEGRKASTVIAPRMGGRYAGNGTTPVRGADLHVAGFMCVAHPSHACDGSGKPTDTAGSAAEGGGRSA